MQPNLATLPVAERFAFMLPCALRRHYLAMHSHPFLYFLLPIIPLTSPSPGRKRANAKSSEECKKAKARTAGGGGPE